MEKTRRFNIQTLALMAVLIALQIILTRMFAVNLGESLRISFGFVPNAVAGMLLGPLPAMIVAGISDLMGALLFPSGPIYLGFTVTAMTGGLIYGLFLYQKAFTVPRVVLCKLCVMLICNVALNTLWLDLLYGKAFFVILPTRLVKNLIQFPVDAAVLYGLGRLVRLLPHTLRPRI